ncbi:MAG TPA: aminotransferase class I/II-fold pyridoxal phosphate-dependent enzyme, partial [Candidatus Acidoferrum sp.]
RTFSKIYGLAGLRVGYAISSPELAARLSPRQLPWSVNVVAARTAIAALSDQPYAKKVGSLNSNDRQEFYNQVNARMLRCLDSKTNFVLLKTGRPGNEVAELLRARSVSVAAGYPHFEKHVRVSLGLPTNMQAFWRAWDECMPHHPVDSM